MRLGLLVLGLAIGLGLYQGFFARACDRATTAALSEEARLAIDVRCKDQPEHAAATCRSTLKKLYLSGSLDPDTTLRTYCETVRTGGWGGGRPAPPKVCVERYGGWAAG